MPTASAAFSEYWLKEGSSDALIPSLTDSTAAGRVCNLLHRDLKAPEHLLSYELFRDADAPSSTSVITPDTRFIGNVAPFRAPARKTIAAEGPVAIFVFCRVEDMATFAPSMTLHIETTLANEPGCLAFAWHADIANDATVLLYELYASRDALSEHRRSAHLAAFRARSEHMMLDARIHYAALLPESDMGEMGAFFGAA